MPSLIPHVPYIVWPTGGRDLRLVLATGILLASGWRGHPPRLKSSTQKGKSSGGQGLRVDGSLDLESVVVYEPVENEGDQFVDGLTPVVAGDFRVQVPADAFKRVGVWRVRGQMVDGYPVPPLGEELPHQSAIMELRVVADDVDVAIARQTPLEVVQVPDEQGGVPLGSRHAEQKPARAPPERTGQMPFGIGPGVSTSACVLRRIHIDPIVGLVLTSTSSSKTAVSSGGRSASNRRIASSSCGLAGSFGPKTAVVVATRVAPVGANGGPFPR